MSFPSLFLNIGLTISTILSTVGATTYKLGDTYSGSTFLDGFDFFTGADPTNGFVKYLDRTTAANNLLVRMVGNDNYLGVDYSSPLTVADGVGRGSVRIESKKRYTKGLFIVDVKHMPGGICGTWPAFWSFGSGTWPQTGEIDIIEGVNANTQNKMALHTDTNCKTDGLGQTGAQSLYNCALDSASGASGCDVNAVEANTYGAGFNTATGGVYAMEWTSKSIKVWFFPRGRIPASITADAPDTATFGTPNSNFEGACDMDARFKEHKFIFDTTFCGDWAGNVYGDSSCTKYTGLSSMDSCKKFVAETPAAFRNAYWQITYFKTYVASSAVSSSSSTRSSSIASSTTSRASTLVTSTRTSSAASPTATKKVSTDATCGGTNGFTCQGSTFGQCCSSAGWCGSTSAYCSTGCQSSFGTCGSSSSSSSRVAASSSAKTSSPAAAISSTKTSSPAAAISSTKTSSPAAAISSTKTSSPAAAISSTKTSSPAAASPSTKTSSSTAAAPTKKVTTDATCGGSKGFTCQGSSFGNCCSSAGWCGSTSAYCGTGCNKSFGTCS